MRIDETESERRLPRVPSVFPIFRLLFCAGNILPDPPSLALPIGRTQIGRDVCEEEGIALPLSRKASRRHALCEVKQEGARLEVKLTDLGSKNGTHVNGRHCQSALLQDGDVVRLGDALLLLRWESLLRPDPPIAPLQGISMPVRELRRRIAELAAARAPVLLLGESGTGKELTARALHDLSGRSGRFVAVNCSAIPESLAESHLFGHLPGSFTGAISGHDGLFRAARGGTLFLDEIGDLPRSLQPKLLRILEDNTATPVGSTRATPIDVRIVAATNRNLKAELAAGRFREDLYARLCGLVIRPPPLRARREDILLLLEQALGSEHPPLTTALAEALVIYDWPLNVRELRQLATHLQYCSHELPELDLEQLEDRLQLHPDGEAVPAQELPQPAAPVVSPRPPVLGKPLPSQEVERLLREHHGIIARVAAVAGRSPRQIRRWIEQYNIDVKLVVG